MVETSDEIETHIRHRREDLSSNLSELEGKVKSMADWRQQFQRSPGTFLAAAAGAGLLLAMLTNGRRAVAAPVPTRSVPSTGAPLRARVAGALEGPLSEIKDALIAVAAGHATNMLARLVPGFEQHLADSRTHPRSQDGASRSRPGVGPLAH
jgi:hypothetical protein